MWTCPDSGPFLKGIFDVLDVTKNLRLQKGLTDVIISGVALFLERHKRPSHISEISGNCPRGAEKQCINTRQRSLDDALRCAFHARGNR